MSRLLFLAVIIVVIYWLLKSFRKQLPLDDSPKESDRGEAASGQTEDMVRCVHCGVHLPKSESILAGGEFYCSKAHYNSHTEKPKP